METPKISVIVAVYKAEAYLHRCLDSLLAQTFRDFEILLVDDGSPDKSGEICDEYAEKDVRIRVFHKENGGVGSARQCGIDHAKGEYTTHVDPDDWVEPTMLADLYTKAKEEDADMVISDCYIEYQKRTIYQKQKPSSLAVKAVLADILVSGKIMVSLCGRLIRLSCYQNGHIIFPLNFVCGEDGVVLIKLLCNEISKVSYVPCAYYHYDRYINPNSLTKARTHVVDAWMAVCDYCKADVYTIAPWIYKTQLSYIAYEYFRLNLMKASDFQDNFSNTLGDFLHSRASIKVKFFILLSAIGYKEVAYKIHRSMKRIYNSLFKKKYYGIA